MRWLVLALLLSGCATVQLPAGQSALCAPAGLPAPTTWRVLDAKTIILPTTDGRLLVAVEAMSTVQGYVLKTYWVDGMLGFVDPAPDDLKAAMWFDPQIVSVKGERIYAQPAPRWQSCEWREYRLSERT